MLCGVEIGTVKGHKQSQAHYWVVAETLVEAIGMAKKQCVEDYPEDGPSWTILEAYIKSVDDPVTKDD